MAVSTISDLRSRLDKDRYDSDPGKLLADYTSDDNRLMRLAATEGRQMANRRGGLNSSIHAGASMDAMARTALPLAQQRSEQIEGRNIREEGAVFAGIQTENETGAAKELASQNFGFESQLSAQDAAQRGDLMDREFTNRGQLSAQEFGQEQTLQDKRLGTERELAQLDASTRENLMSMEEEMRVRLAGLETDREQYQDATNMITTFTEQYQQSMRSILNNPDMAATDRNALLENAGTLLNLQTDMVRELYGVDISWTGDDFTPTEGAEGNTSGGTTPGNTLGETTNTSDR